jgi:phage baseplate assembly protein W
MSSINFKQPARTTDKAVYAYSDIHLDLQEDKSIAKNSKSDIKVDYDIKAIKNSIRNIFNTRKGDRLLEPDFGVSLEKYLFEPISTDAGYLIAADIKDGITAYEPRVVVMNVNVIVHDEWPGYEVIIAIFIPKINISTVINTSITQNGIGIN